MHRPRMMRHPRRMRAAAIMGKNAAGMRPGRAGKGAAMQEPKDPRTSGKVAMYALLVIVALTAVMVWVAA